MKLNQFHALDITEMIDQEADMRPKRDHKGKDKSRKAAGGASKNYKKRLNELREESLESDY